jgi:predicted esterase YcpF (UPF0227 family)
MNINDLLRKIEIFEAEDEFTSISDSLLNNTIILLKGIYNYNNLTIDDMTIDYCPDWYDEIDIRINFKDLIVLNIKVKETKYIVVKENDELFWQLNFNTDEIIDYEEIFNRNYNSNHKNLFKLNEVKNNKINFFNKIINKIKQYLNK